LVAAGRAALVAVALYRFQLFPQLGQPVADFTAIKVERAFAGAWALLAAAAGRRFAHPRGYVF